MITQTLTLDTKEINSENVVLQTDKEGDTSTQPRLTGLINPAATTGNNEHAGDNNEGLDGGLVGSSSPHRAPIEQPTEPAETAGTIDDSGQVGGFGFDGYSGNGQASRVVVATEGVG